MKHTPFTTIHQQLGAKMADFAGYLMPISYTGIKEEHDAVRKNAGVFDVSHMGEFIVKGEGALALIQQLTTNDVSKLTAGKAQYNCFTNPNGGIIDDLIVYCLEENSTYMLVVNAGNIEKDWAWVNEHNAANVTLKNISDKTGLIAVQGPNATKIIQPLTSVNVIDMPYYTFQKGTFAGVDNVLISATGYTGSGGVELYFEDIDNNGTTIWNAIFEAGKSSNIQPIGLGARDTLRLEKGYCLYGNDIDDTTSPLEAGLSWIVKWDKDFVAKPILETQKQNGLTRKLVGIEMVGKGIARHGYPVCDANGNTIGEVTSGTMSPSLNKPIAMAYIATGNNKIGTTVYVKIRESLIEATVVKMPFV